MTSQRHWYAHSIGARVVEQRANVIAVVEYVAVAERRALGQRSRAAGELNIDGI